jgi:hypothetical protein
MTFAFFHGEVLLKSRIPLLNSNRKATEKCNKCDSQRLSKNNSLNLKHKSGIKIKIRYNILGKISRFNINKNRKKDPVPILYKRKRENVKRG